MSHQLVIFFLIIPLLLIPGSLLMYYIDKYNDWVSDILWQNLTYYFLLSLSIYSIVFYIGFCLSISISLQTYIILTLVLISLFVILLDSKIRKAFFLQLYKRGNIYFILFLPLIFLVSHYIFTVAYDPMFTAAKAYNLNNNMDFTYGLGELSEGIRLDMWPPFLAVLSKISGLSALKCNYYISPYLNVIIIFHHTYLFLVLLHFINLFQLG